MKKIMVTGSSGLIGAELVESLKNKCDLILVDINDQDKNIPENSSFIKSDIRDLTKMDFEGVTGIIHLAAVSRVIWGEKYPLETWSVNVEGTQHLLNLAQSNRTIRWVIYGSSREVYGEPQIFPVSENHSLIPTNRYGISKLAAEGLIKTFQQTTGIPTMNLRFSNVYGSLNDQMDRVIPKFIQQALKNQPIQLEGKGNTFDFTHVEDTVSGILQVIDNINHLGYQSNWNNGALNICTGIDTSLEELANLIIETTDSASQILEVPPRSYDVKHFRGDWSTAQEVISYRPKIKLYDGIKYLTQKMEKQLLEVLT